MLVTHTNRKGDLYYLHQGFTKKGNPKYTFSRKKDGKLAEKIPQGYQIYENPNGLVFLRREQPKIFSDEEMAIIENGMKDYAGLEFYKIDVKGNTIIIFLPLQDVDAIKEVVSEFSLKTPKEITNILHRFITFVPEMQLILTNKGKRLFSLKMYSYSGLKGHWMTLETSSGLKRLVKKYFKHLAKESFFNLSSKF